MATVLVSDTNLTNIANAIREKNGETTSYKVDEMAEAINNLPETGSGGGSAISYNITSNNPYGQIFSPTKGYPGQELIIVYEVEISLSSALFLPTYNNFEDTVEHTFLFSFGTSNQTGANVEYCIYSIIMPDSDVYIDIL